MDMYIDIHRKDGVSTSAKIQSVSSWIYNRFQQMMYLHGKQRHYARNRQKRTIKKRNPEQYKITAFHIFCAKVQNESQMNIRWLLLGYLGGNVLKKIQGLHYPGTDSTPKDYAKYAQIQHLINEIQVLLEGGVQTLWEFLKIKKSLWKIVSISMRNDDSRVWEKAKELLGWVLDWFTKSLDDIDNFARYIEKNDWTSYHSWASDTHEEIKEQNYSWLTRAEAEEYEDMYNAWVAKVEARERNLAEWESEWYEQPLNLDAREEYSDVEEHFYQKQKLRREKDNEYSDQVYVFTEKAREVASLYYDFQNEYQSIYWYPSEGWWKIMDDEFYHLTLRIWEIEARNIYNQTYTTNEIMKEIDQWFLWLINESLCPLWAWIREIKKEPKEVRELFIKKYLSLFS